MLALFLRPVLHPLAIECHPIDSHLLHVLFAQVASVLRVEGGHLTNLFASMRPSDAGKSRARISRIFERTFGVQHHLPKSFDAGVTLSVEREWRGGEMGQNSKPLALRKNPPGRLR